MTIELAAQDARVQVCQQEVRFILGFCRGCPQCYHRTPGHISRIFFYFLLIHSTHDLYEQNDFDSTPVNDMNGAQGLVLSFSLCF